MTLQPIPPELTTKAKVLYHLEKSVLDTLLDAFGNLEDINSRFLVLQKASEVNTPFIPSFTATFRKAFTSFQAAHGSLMAKLAKAMSRFFAEGSNLEEILKLKSEAEALCTRYTPQDDGYEAPSYPETLSILEAAYADVEAFMVDLQGEKLNASTLQDVVEATVRRQMIVLYVMPPLHRYGHQNRRLFLDLVRAGHHIYPRRHLPLFEYVLYAEDTKVLAKHFPDCEVFRTLKNPGIFFSKSNRGHISWSQIPFDDLEGRELRKLYDFYFYYFKTQ